MLPVSVPIVYAYADPEDKYTAQVNELQSNKSKLREQWAYENEYSRLPTISWPEDFPEENEIPALEKAFNQCPVERQECAAMGFKLATALVTIQPTPEEVSYGGALMRRLADIDYPDGIVGLALCLLEEKGGHDENLEEAAKLLKHAVYKHNHAHGAYELGVMYYQGIGVKEDEKKALELFRKAAVLGHCGSMYMFGDCLLEGIGTHEDKAEALGWLMFAAEKGHRGARSRILALLDDDGKTDHGLYSDSSRQSYAKRNSKLQRKMTVARSRV